MINLLLSLMLMSVNLISTAQSYFKPVKAIILKCTRNECNFHDVQLQLVLIRLFNNRQSFIAEKRTNHIYQCITENGIRNKTMHCNTTYNIKQEFEITGQYLLSYDKAAAPLMPIKFPEIYGGMQHREESLSKIKSTA